MKCSSHNSFKGMIKNTCMLCWFYKRMIIHAKPFVQLHFSVLLIHRQNQNVNKII
jgi:hypothetical protein